MEQKQNHGLLWTLVGAVFLVLIAGAIALGVDQEREPIEYEAGGDVWMGSFNGVQMITKPTRVRGPEVPNPRISITTNPLRVDASAWCRITIRGTVVAEARGKDPECVAR